jgi:hypothetical protein
VAACADIKIQPGPVMFRADSVILTFTTTHVLSTRFRFSDFKGTTDEAITRWYGGTCRNYYDEPMCEAGTAVWHR